MRIKLLSACLLASNLALATTPIDGWYSGVFGGYISLPGNIDTYRTGVLYNHTAYTDGYNAGGRVGFQSNPIRYELEYTYLHAVAKRFNYAFAPQQRIRGYSQANLLMANIYYDFPEILPSISPYLGVGLGYANIQTSLTSAGPVSIRYFRATANEFAYQGTAGFTFNYAENYAFNLAYRYVATDKANTFGNVFQAHIANAGVVYRFDQGKYK